MWWDPWIAFVATYTASKLLDSAINRSGVYIQGALSERGMTERRWIELIDTGAIRNLRDRVVDTGKLPDDQTFAAAIDAGISEKRASSEAWRRIDVSGLDLVAEIERVLESTPGLIATPSEERIITAVLAKIESEHQETRQHMQILVQRGDPLVLDCDRPTSAPALTPDVESLFGEYALPPEIQLQFRWIDRLLEDGRWYDASRAVRHLRASEQHYSTLEQHKLETALELTEGLIFMLRGKLRQAEERCHSAHDLDPANSMAFVWYQHMRLLCRDLPGSLLPAALGRLEQDRGLLPLRVHVAILYLLTGDHRQARTVLGDETQARLDPWALKAWTALHLAEGDVVAAKAAARQCIRRVPHDAEAWFNYAVALRAAVGGLGVPLHRSAQRPTGLRCAERCFARAATLCSAPFTRDLRILARAEQTLCRVDLGLGTECIRPAESVASQAETASRRSQQRWSGAMAEALSRAERWTEAVAQWRKVLGDAEHSDEAGKVTPQLLLAHTQALWHAGEVEEAALTLMRFDNDGLSADHQFLRAQLEIAVRSRSPECTDDEIDRLLTNFRDHFSFYPGIEAFCGSVWAARDRWDKAAEAFSHQVLLQPDDAISWRNLAHVRAFADDYSQAYLDVREALRVQRQHFAPNTEWLDLAIAIAQRVHEYDQIIAWCDEALECPSPDLSFLRARALAYYEKRDFLRAARDFREYFSRTCRTDTLSYLADSLFRTGAYNEACAVWRCLEQSVPEDPIYSIRIVDGMVVAGDRLAAWREIARVVHRFPRHSGVLSYACQFAWADRRDEAFLSKILPNAGLRPMPPLVSGAPPLIVVRGMPDRSDTPLFERALAENAPFLIYARHQLNNEEWDPGQASLHLGTSERGAQNRWGAPVAAEPVALMLLRDLELEYLCRQTFGTIFYSQDWIDALQHVMFQRDGADVGALLRWSFAWTGTLLQCVTARPEKAWCTESMTQKASDIARTKQVPLLVAEASVASLAVEAGIPVITLRSWLDHCKEVGLLSQADLERVYLQFLARGASSVPVNSGMVVTLLRASGWKLDSVVQRIFSAMADATDSSLKAPYRCSATELAPSL